MKWADFGLYDVTIRMINSSNTKKWFAPEINKGIRDVDYDNSYYLSGLHNNGKNSVAADVWSAGAVFYYYLTKGKHPEDLKVTSWKQFPREVPSPSGILL